MDPDDLDHLTRHWAKTPPVHIALARVDAILCALAGVKREQSAPQVAPRKPPSETEILSMVALANGRC